MTFLPGGPFLYDPDRERPAVDLDAWQLTDCWRIRHKATGCEFRVIDDERGPEVHLRTWRPGRLPPPDQLADLAQTALWAQLALLREWSENLDHDGQNRAERVAPWG